ncbi:MAG: hypothetical protein DHS20C18_29770 [Saprospiraceae bacterium]|nr:MAG: hypothetical protein DHS20C18_29770 [Saprospiraceae bacterium]
MEIKIPLFLICLLFFSFDQEKPVDPIDRHSLVSRHNVIISEADTLAALSVGNGGFAFTPDITGLQTFPEYYQNGIPLGTQSEWGWHSFPNTGNYQIEDVAVDFETCNDHHFPVAVQRKEGRAKEATNWLRTNPHRLHLGLVGLVLLKSDGAEAGIEDITQFNQKLDMWSGKIVSNYEIEGVPVQVELYAHQEKDQISFRIQSDLIKQGKLKVKFRFPYGNDCHVCPGYDWDHPEKHKTEIVQQGKKRAWLKRTLDQSTYYVGASWSGDASFKEVEPHFFELTPSIKSGQIECSVLFSDNEKQEQQAGFESTRKNSEQGFEKFWETGGAIDFSACTDPRAKELERRVVLSQYLTKIQCAGSYPPQETGLTCNSWYGKFHLEMHWWHGVHFALWGRIGLLEKSMDWYKDVMQEARGTAQWQGFSGVRWQKMTSPEGKISPSSVGEFLAWQQPHPIYFAELFYRQKMDTETLERFKEVVFETADFMASFAQYDTTDGKYHLCQPLIPAQEIFHATETNDPPFELAYWHYGLTVAQKWRERLGFPPNQTWQNVIDNLAPLPQANNLYLPCANAFTAYTVDSLREDHPIVTGAYGMLPISPMIDTTVMGNTFEEIFNHWDWPSTWGWDYPMLAMTAARLGKPELAINALLLDVPKNTYLPNGHNYQDKRLRLYLPGNGGLLTAVSMMAVGWDHAPEKENPGFPDNGKWKIKWEGLKLMP